MWSPRLRTPVQCAIRMRGQSSMSIIPRGVPLSMSRIRPEYLDAHASDRLIFREEPDEGEDEEEEDKKDEDDREEGDADERDGGFSVQAHPHLSAW